MSGPGQTQRQRGPARGGQGLWGRGKREGLLTGPGFPLMEMFWNKVVVMVAQLCDH